MEDFFKIIIYVVAVVIYALVKMRKKPQNTGKPIIPEAPKIPLPHTVPQKSFADNPPRKTAPSLEKSIKKLERDIRATKQTLKPKKKIQSVQARSTDVKNQYETTSDRLEGLSEDSLQGHFDRIQNYNEIENYRPAFLTNEAPLYDYAAPEEKQINPYAEFLKNPENIKTALIAKEIFDRKQY